MPGENDRKRDGAREGPEEAGGGDRREDRNGAREDEAWDDETAGGAGGESERDARDGDGSAAGPDRRRSDRETDREGRGGSGPAAGERKGRPAAGGKEGAPLAGERLRAARENRGVGIEEIAAELHVGPATLLALEENRFDDLGAPVFAKGHLRKYAQALGVPVDDVLADYYRLDREAEPPPVVGLRPRRVPRDFSLAPWLVALLLLIVVAALILWWIGSSSGSVAGYSPATATPGNEAAVPAGEPGALDSPETAGAADPPRAGAASPFDALGTGPAARQAAQPAPSPAAASAERPGTVQAVPSATADAGGGSPVPATEPERIELGLAFSGQCWTEIYDAEGRRLFFGMGREGVQRRLRGAAPLQVLVGDVAAVELTVDGEPYAIPAASRRGRTARLVIDAP